MWTPAPPPNRTRPSAVTVAAHDWPATLSNTYQGRHVDRQSPRTPATASAPADGIFRACAHFYLHLFDTAGGVRTYTRIQSVGAYTIRLPAIVITGIDDLIKNHLLPLIETDPLSDFARQSTDEFRLAIKLTRSTPVCLSPEADKRQLMGNCLRRGSWRMTEQFTLWFSGRNLMSWNSREQ
ncbi:hypothetical protein V8E54_008789 [Elaphomyces granulatus]